MSYCKDGEKPIVRHRFGNGSERTYRSKDAPITVESRTQPTDTTNYQGEGYQISFFNSDTAANPITRIVYDHRIYDVPYDAGLGTVASKWLYAWYCGQPKPEKYSNCPGNGSYPVYTDCLPATQIFKNGALTIDTSIKCPQAKGNKCSIIVRNEVRTIFEEQGECPLIFTVQCGRCADNEIECPSNKYPGYCCHTCEELAGKVRAIKF